MAAYLSPYSVCRHVYISQSLGVAWKVFLAYPTLLDSLNIRVCHGSVLAPHLLSSDTLSTCNSLHFEGFK